jgi:hypothetical protein
MPVPTLTFINPTAGVPRKPVPLRYAILVTGLDAGIICALLSGELHYPGADDEGFEPLLTAYEITSKPSARKVTQGVVESVRSQISPHSKLKAQLKQIPKSFYVWSDDLAQAFQHYIKLVPGYDDAYRMRLDLNWNPGLGNLRPLIEECPNPEKSGSRRSEQAAKVEKRNRQIVAEYQLLHKQFPQLSKSNIATRIAKSGKFERFSRRIRQNLTPEAIRRVINRNL